MEEDIRISDVIGYSTSTPTPTHTHTHARALAQSQLLMQDAVQPDLFFLFSTVTTKEPELGDLVSDK